MKRSTTGIVMMVLLTGAMAGAAALYDDFSSGTLAKWSVTGTAWAVVGGKADTLTGGESNIGTLTSASSISVGSNEFVAFSSTGWPAGPGAQTFSIGLAELNNYVEIRRASDNTLLAKIGANFGEKRIDLGGPETVIIKAIDSDSSAGYAWQTMDNVRTEANVAGTPISNGSLEAGGTGWVLTTTGPLGHGPQVTASSSTLTDDGAYEGNFLIDTTYYRYDAAGTALSPALIATQKYLTFWAKGNSMGGQNYFQLLAQDQTTELARLAPPETWTWTSLSFNLSVYANQTVYLKMVDGNSTGTDPTGGWMAVDYVRQTGPVLPEPASAVLLLAGGALVLRRRTSRCAA